MVTGFFDDYRHVDWVVIDSDVDSFFNHVWILGHGFVEFLDGEFDFDNVRKIAHI